MATIRKRQTQKGTRWDVRFRDDHGIQRCETWPTAQQARQRKAELDSGLAPATEAPVAVASLTVGDLWDRWVATTKTAASASTLTACKAARKSLGDLALGQAGALTRDQVLEWCAHQTTAGYAPVTVRGRLSQLRGAYAWGVREQLVLRNPADGVKGPRLEDPERAFLTAKEVAQLATAIDQRYRAWVLVACYSGLRFGELAGLRWTDVDTERSTITVVSAVARDEVGANRRTVPKTRRSRRTVVLPRPVLDELVKSRPNEVGPDAPVFPAPEGGLLNGPTFARRFFKPAAQAIGRPDITPHSCRHTAASLAIAAGASVSEVMHLLGHSTPLLTLNLYGHLFPESGAVLASKMGQLWQAPDDATSSCDMDVT